jgi:RNA polymerase sigma-70 factor (ECF subfamily)
MADADTEAEDLAAMLAAIVRGERSALRTLYAAQSARLFGVCLRILRDRAAAADAIQDTFLRIWDRAQRFDPARGTAAVWMAAIARHVALDLARARGRELPSGAPDLGVAPVEDDPVAAQWWTSTRPWTGCA